MSVRVAINGFGRIGRNVLRAIAESGRKDIEVVGINDLGPVETNAHLLRFDSVHGRFPGEVTVKGDTISVGNGAIKVTAVKDPAQLPWKDLGVDIALECTGIFTSKDKASAHLDRRRQARAGVRAGRRRRSHGGLRRQSRQARPRTTRSSPTPPARPTASRRSPRCCNNAVGIDKGFMTTIHSYTGDQPVARHACTRTCTGRAPPR